MTNNLGLIHIYCGDGKGKTTASMGLAVRALGDGYNVAIAQFLKNGKSGEFKILGNLPNLTVIVDQPIKKFTNQMTDEEKNETKEINKNIIEKVKNLLNEKHIDLLVLDETCGAIGSGLLDEQVVIDFLENKPEHLEVVLTGRNPSEKLISMANYVTEMKKIKHPFDEGIKARKGIEA